GAQALSRARLYEALRQSDERLKMALRAARAVAWSWDLDAGHITRTDEHPEIYALPAIAKSDEAFALVHPDDQDRYRSTVEQAVREGGSYQSEFRITDPDTGNLVWLEERGEVRKEGTGKVPRMVGVAMDITERMHAGEALQAANARFRTLFDSNIIGILTANRSRIFEANDAFLDMVGYTRDDLAEEKISWRAMTPPEYAHLDDAALQEMLATGRATPFEKEYYHKDGRRVPILLGSGLLQREPQECVSFVVDITERKQADEERERLLAQVENERALLRAVLGQMPAAVQIAEAPSGKLILTNGRAATIWRCQFESLEELREWRQGRGFHSDGRPYERGEWPLVRSLTTGEVVMGEEIELLRGDGTRGLVATNSAPIRDERGNIVAAVSVYCDLTEQRRLEKLKDDFLAMASHELRTPITGVKGYSQLLLRKAAERGEDHPDKKIVQTIDRHCDRLTKLVDELLEVSRLNLGRLELRRDRFELSSLAAEAVDRLTLATTGHHLSFQSAGPAVVLADRDRLEQVLDNLITNAIRYSPGGGEIGVTLECRDGEAVVSVNDRGVGIPKHKQNRVFEHFYRAHAGSRHDHGGMGVGLYISQKIVQRHGGEMWFESEEGQGSTFYFSLPLCSELDSAS
ncbi:MAG: ATP-binding protein, partial [Chloroflexi bacterium]|nr:ATP-binding protein [Chloroflexota bacterium]